MPGSLVSLWLAIGAACWFYYAVAGPKRVYRTYWVYRAGAGLIGFDLSYKAWQQLEPASQALLLSPPVLVGLGLLAVLLALAFCMKNEAR